jgi:SAM-dependent methyltransferase
MTQITNGIRKILSSPIVYDSMQNLMGARNVRRELVEEFIRPKDFDLILDLGCGTAQILQYLPKTIEYWGFDISQRYISAAKEKYSTRGNFHCSYLVEENLNTLPKFDQVLAIGLLHHLDNDEVKEFFSLAKQALKPNGRVITLDPCLVIGQNPIARFLILNDRGQNVRTSKDYTSLAQNAFQNVKATVRHRTWIPYTHCFMECSK